MFRMAFFNGDVIGGEIVVLDDAQTRHPDILHRLVVIVIQIRRVEGIDTTLEISNFQKLI